MLGLRKGCAFLNPLPDAPIHAGRMHAYLHLPIYCLGLVDVPKLQYIG